MKKIPRWIIASTLIIVLLLTSSAAAQLFPRGVRWRQLQTEHFKVVFIEEHRDIAKNIAGMAESVHRDMSRFLKYTKTKKTYLILTDNIDTFDRLNFSTTQKAGKDRVVLFLSDITAGIPSFDIPSQQWLLIQFIYQYTYVMRHRMDTIFRTVFSAAFPDSGFAGWMDGGMALYMITMLEGNVRRSPYFNMMMRAELLKGGFTSLEQKTSTGSKEWPGDAGVFLYGYSFILYLAETYGPERLSQLNQLQNTTLPQPKVIAKDPFQKIYGKTLGDLQQEWLATIQRQYEDHIQTIQSRPLTQTTALSDSGYYTGTPLFSPDGAFVYYIEDSSHRERSLVQLRLADREKTYLREGNFSGSFSITSDGRQIYFSKTEVYKIYNRFSDLYRLDLATRKVTRLTKGARAFDPAIAPDGKTLVYVTNNAGKTSLLKMDLASGQSSTLLEASAGMQIRHPSFSSNGTTLAIQILKDDETGYNIYLLNSDGTNLSPLTVDAAQERSPSWGVNDSYLFFTSDRSGVPNILAYSFRDQRLYQVTNLLTGGFSPTISRDGRYLLFEKYSGRGFDVHLTELDPQQWTPVSPMPIEKSSTFNRFGPTNTSAEGRYTALPSLLTWPITLPILGSDEDGIKVGLLFLGDDALDLHKYSLSVLYGPKSGRFGFDLDYRYNRFYLPFGLFGYDRSEEYAGYFEASDEDDESYWERQQGGGVVTGIPFYRTRKTTFYLAAEYEYQERSRLTEAPPEDQQALPPDTGVLTDIAARLVWKSFDFYRYSISAESGFLTSAEYRWYDEALGGDYNINAFIGDLNAYIPMPFQHHVLALRAAGGTSDGDTLTQGVFQLGGLFFEVQADLLNRPEYYLRGYERRQFRGDRFVLGTAEYRLPLWHVERSSLNGLLYWNSIAATAFFDAGHAWEDAIEDPDLKYGAGGELSLNLGYRYGQVPLSFDIGVAYGFDKDVGVTQVYFQFRTFLL